MVDANKNRIGNKTHNLYVANPVDTDYQRMDSTGYTSVHESDLNYGIF